MTTIHERIRRWGNSLALVIPAEKAKEMDLEEGIAVDLEIRKCQHIDAFGILKGKRPFKREDSEHQDLW